MSPLIRKNAASLDDQERKNFVYALLKMKKSGEYDDFIRRHAIASGTTSVINGGWLNGAHRGPAFLCWHRALLLEFEQTLQKYLSSPMGVPYWDWGSDPTGTSVFRDDFMGGNGGIFRRRVGTGPFANPKDDPNLWVTVRYDVSSQQMLPTGPLERDFGKNGSIPNFSTIKSVMLGAAKYDAFPYNVASTSGFRVEIERQLHDVVHVWVGGHMASVPVAPNDPVFYLHHANIDRLFARWQEAYPTAAYPAPNDPNQDPLPAGQGWGDTMLQLTQSPSSVWDITQLGFAYERNQAVRRAWGVGAQAFGPVDGDGFSSTVVPLPTPPAGAETLVAGFGGRALSYKGDDHHLLIESLIIVNSLYGWMPNTLTVQTDLEDNDGSKYKYQASGALSLLYFGPAMTH